MNETIQINRRGFIQRIRNYTALSLGALLYAGTLGTSLTLTGCGDPVAELEAWIPVALSAVKSIVTLLGPIVPAPVAATIVLIQAGFAALLTAIQDYKSGSGVLADIANAITAVESAFQAFFASLGVPAGLLATIEGLAGVVISTIEAFAAEIGGGTPATKLTVGGKVFTVAPAKRSLKQFNHDFNVVCVANGHPELELK